MVTAYSMGMSTQLGGETYLVSFQELSLGSTANESGEQLSVGKSGVFWTGFHRRTGPQYIMSS